MSKTVWCAMSGGVDSSVAALLLQKQGFTVGGVTMQLFSGEDIGLSQGASCGAESCVRDAKAVCDRLGITHTALPLATEFRRCVIDAFADGYRRGETPNPCVECNRHLKFSRILGEAQQNGFDNIATGHYARVDYDETRGRWVLKKAADPTKDQSYVLYSLTQEVLAHTLLPLGELTKTQIREIAHEHRFASADKPDSQDICFIPDGDYAAFLEKVMGVTAPTGDFVRDDGRVVGRHKGLYHYTVGQRKGLGIAAEKPLYVLEKDTQTNRVILGDNAALFSSGLIARDCNWIAIEALTAPLRVTAKTRYKQAETPATVTPLDNGTIRVTFDTPQRAITAGQAVVFYDGDIVVGGGTIVRKDG